MTRIRTDPRGTPVRRVRPHRWRLLLWRLRFVAAWLCLSLAFGFGLARLSPPADPTSLLVVTARPLLVGAEVTATDVRVTQVPAGSVPDGAHTTTAEVVGKTLAIGVPPGLVLVDALLAGGAPEGPSGTVVVPVRFGDSVAGSLLRAGDRVDVIGSAGTLSGVAGVGEPLARRALVLSMAGARSAFVPHKAQDPFEGSPETSDVVLLAVSPAEATAIAGAAGWATLTAVFVQ
jgi:pilus assembly protein CpaB